VGIKLFVHTPSDRGAAEIPRAAPPAFSEQPAAIADEPDFMLAGSDPEIIAPEKLETLATENISVALAGPLNQAGKQTGTAGTGATRTGASGAVGQAAGAKNAQKRAAAANTTRPASAAQSKWGVQVGAFVNAGSASTLVSEIKKQGYAASVSTSAASGKTFHRVRVGAGNSREAADRLAVELRGKGYPVSVVPML
jgi:DedD protein